MKKKINMIEALAGTVLLSAIGPLAFLGYLLIVVVALFGNFDRIRQGVHALDHFVNATIFNGYAWESISSHAWRERDEKWAKFIIWLTGKFQKNHCERCNKREQDVVNLMLKKRLHEENIGK
jgi:hypothetical protein